MKILHTADLHLTEKAEERWDALDELVALARSRQVSAMVIAGDLFDREVEAETVRHRLRAALRGSDFETIIIPGNHDFKSYRSGLYFGDNITVITDWQKPVVLGRIAFWGLPFEQISGGKIVNRLQEIASLISPADKNILLFHGELLDTTFSRHELGDEGDRRYMPVKLSYFDSIPLQYVLAGHFHSRYAAWNLPGGGLFIYPGSPAAVTRRETGRRKANLVSTEEPPVELELNSFHYEEFKITLDPYETANPLSMLDHKLEELHPSARLLLTVEGLFNSFSLGMNESELAQALIEKAAGCSAGEPVFDFYDVQHVLEDDLFKQFNARLAETDCSPELKEQVKEMVVRAFRVVKACS